MNTPTLCARRHQLNVPRQRGVALVVALIMLIPITYVAASLATRVAVEETMSSNQRDGAQALFIADTGIDAALTAIEKQVVGDSFDALLSYAISHGGQLLDDVGGIALTDIHTVAAPIPFFCAITMMVMAILRSILMTRLY